MSSSLTSPTRFLLKIRSERFKFGKMNRHTKAAIDKFIEDSFLRPLHKHNSWIQTKEIDLYLRVGYHAVGTQAYRLLDIANVNVKRPGRGLFTEILEYCQAKTPYAGVFLENVLNPRLMDHMIRLQKQDARWIQRGESFAWLKEAYETVEETVEKAAKEDDAGGTARLGSEEPT